MLAAILRRIRTASTTAGRVAAVLTLFALSPASGLAQVPAARSTVSAIRTREAPTIDGRLDEAIWRSSDRIATFVQERPVEGAPATEQTEIRRLRSGTSRQIPDLSH